MRLRIYWLLYILLGFVPRLWWISHGGNTLDELTSYGFVLAPGWASAFWDNSPPVYYLFQKAFQLICVGELTNSAFALVVSSISFIIFAVWLRKNEASNWTLLFWALNPISILNSSPRPTVLAELAGILFFITFQRAISTEKTTKPMKRRLIFSLFALALTTYTAAVAAAISFIALYKRFSRTELLVAGFFVSVSVLCVIYLIHWETLNWLSTSSQIDLVLSGFRAVFQFWAMSAPLFLACFFVAVRKRQFYGLPIVAAVLAILLPLITQHRLSEPRFLIFLNSFAIVSVDEVIRSLRRPLFGCLIFIFVIPTLAWYGLREKSGWPASIKRFQGDPNVLVFLKAPASVRYVYREKNLKSLPAAALETIAEQCVPDCWVVWGRNSTDSFTGEIATDSLLNFKTEEFSGTNVNSLEPVYSAHLRWRSK